MSKKPEVSQVTDLQLEILQLLWERGEASVSEVHEALTKRSRKMAYTTVMTLCKRMANKGLLNYRQRERAYIYSAAVKRQGILKRLLGGIVERAFGGRDAKLAMSVLADATIDEHELAELRKLLSDKERQLLQRGKSR